MMKKYLIRALAALAFIGALPVHAAGGSGIVEKLFLQSGSGAVTRTYSDKLADSVNIKDFGAKCDGGDDSAAIQAALNAGAGSTVNLGKGTCVAQGLTIPNNTKLRGDGQKVSILKTKGGANTDLIKNSGAAGSGVTIEAMALDGNAAANTSGRNLYFLTDPAIDGPALILRDVLLTGGAGDGAGASTFISGLNWVHFDNVRFVNNPGSLWLSTNDSTFNSLFVGNSGVSLNVPALLVGGSNNQFFGGYFGGNGNGTSSTAPQVKVYGGKGNFFIGCVNDSANGNGYEFRDYAGNPANYNQIIGGYITNPSQSVDSTYYHVLFIDTSSYNQIIGVRFDNTLTKKGKFAVVELASAGNNLIQGSTFGTFGTQALATSITTRVLDSLGLPQGVDSYSVVGASPFTYTNSYSGRVAVYIYGGTVTSIVKNGITIFNASPATVWLEQGESFVITYSAAPAIHADRH